jgi:hypothetical protein
VPKTAGPAPASSRLFAAAQLPPQAASSDQSDYSEYGRLTCRRTRLSDLSALIGRFLVLLEAGVGTAIQSFATEERGVMKLYVCWGSCPVPGGRPCRIAYEALEKAGHDPKVIKAHGGRLLPDFLDWAEGGHEAQRLTDNRRVPILLTDEGEVVAETRNIVAWAERHPASAGTASGS